ncbi:MAG: ATP-dependent Clp protease adaptor ClpS [Fimbriimonadales bacterium]
MPVLEVPEGETLDRTGEWEGHVWQVILYNDDYHLFDQVVAQVQKATGYPRSRAFAITMEAHTSGRAVVWTGDIEACLRVEGVLREIGLHTDIVA